MTDPSCAVTVTDRAGQKRQAVGRAARIIWLVLIYQDKLNAGRRPGRLMLNFGAGESVKAEFSEQWEEV